MSGPLPTETDPQQPFRWALYTVLIALALGQTAGKILAVNSVNLSTLEKQRLHQAVERAQDRWIAEGVEGEVLEQKTAEATANYQRRLRLQRPFLSGNDRSRWMAVRALAENGSFEIDPFLEEPTWDTIDMVQHRGPDGELHLYSSKPPLLMVLLAAPYWLVVQLTGMTLGTHPYVVGRLLLLLVNGLALTALLGSVAHLVERLGRGDLDRVLVVAIAAFGTMLSAFTPVLNNHLIAAAAAAVACAAWVRLMSEERPLLGTTFLAGLAAAFATACELPALALVAAILLSLLIRRPGETLRGFVPGVLIVVAAFFGTNFWAHATLRPPYAHRHAENPDDNWYDYEYTTRGKTRDSYWRNPQGIDRGEASRQTYALHTLVGHHGVLSLTPAWGLSLLGSILWLGWGRRREREFAAATLAITAACLIFYIGLRPQADRNYGGMTSGFRWLFWLAPMWLAMALPAGERIGRSRVGFALIGVLLFFSALSASYPTWNPWTQPWIYQGLQHLGFELL